MPPPPAEEPPAPVVPKTEGERLQMRADEVTDEVCNSPSSLKQLNHLQF